MVESYTDIVVIAGPSGSGKGTVIAELPGDFKKTVSATTRGIREGETPGVDYFFISEAEFFALRDNGGLAEWNRYGSNYYGTPEAQIKSIHDEGKIAVLDIDVNGARNIKKLHPEAAMIFLLLPSANEQISRLRARKSETEAQIKQRLELTRSELAQSGMFDRIFVNYDGKVKDTAAAILDFLAGKPSPADDTSQIILHYFDNCPLSE